MFVKPFPLEVVRMKPGGSIKSKGGILGGKKMKKTMKDAPIAEEESVHIHYSQNVKPLLKYVSI